MMNFLTACSSVVRSLCALFFLGSLWSSILLCALLLLQKKCYQAGLPGFTGILSYFGLQLIGILENSPQDASLAGLWAETFGKCPVALVLLLMTMLAGIQMVLYIRCVRWSRNQIGRQSIKEAIDTIPVGLCYSELSGQVRLKNRVMEEMCRSCTGGPLKNANHLYDALSTGTLPSELKRETLGDVRVLLFPDGTCISYNRTRISDGNRDFWMLITADLSEIYARMKTLADQQEKVSQLNTQLTRYNRSIIASITEKEILSARVKLHDELGAELLMAKKLIVSGGTEEEMRTLTSQLKRSMDYLKKEAQVREVDPYAQLIETAEKLGVRIDFRGDLPASPERKEILVTAIHECLTNMLRYAHGDCLKVEASRKEDADQICITNNGEAPSGEITEKGGLLYLRRMTEKVGGTMMIVSVPFFSLTIRIPKEKNDAL